MGWAEGDHAVDAEHRKKNENRSEQEDESVGALGNNIFLEH